MISDSSLGLVARNLENNHRKEDHIPEGAGRALRAYLLRNNYRSVFSAMILCCEAQACNIAEFPQDDVLEARFVLAENANRGPQTILASEAQTLAILTRAVKALQLCAQSMRQVEEPSVEGS
jgi:hypothetical protein